MMELIGYSISSHWGPRAETPLLIADRFLSLVDRLASIDQVFVHWICRAGDKPTMLDDVRSDMAKEVELRVTRTESGEALPIDGYSIGVANSEAAASRRVTIYAKAGTQIAAPHYINYAHIETSHKVVPDPAIVTYPIFRAALLALAETFDVTWCSAYPDDIMRIWGGGYFRLGWMSYVSPRFAPLITPPKTAIVEYQPNGALFMAATDETFVTANPEHVAVARDIKAAIAPLDALPWPLDAE